MLVSAIQRELVLLLLLLHHFSRVRLSVTPETAATRLPPPWDSPGKNTGAQEMQVQSLGGEDSPGGRYDNPLQYSCLGNPMDGILAGYSP